MCLFFQKRHYGKDMFGDWLGLAEEIQNLRKKQTMCLFCQKPGTTRTCLETGEMIALLGAETLPKMPKEIAMCGLQKLNVNELMFGDGGPVGSMYSCARR
jgi:hypothetical protein